MWGAVRIMVAMSGGVDSSVAAALLADAGHDVVGVTLKLWGGDSDSGCCSVGDVEDARRVAAQLGLAHHVFNFTEPFAAAVVAPYVAAHAAGQTPNPCIECNRHAKFGRLLDRARRLGFDALATGHHARTSAGPAGGRRLRRGIDPAKDQSYVLSVLTADQRADLVLPVGELTKAEVRAEASRRGLGTATKPDSQDVCFIHSTTGRGRFVGERTPLHAGDVVDAATGAVVGGVPAVELITVGQRRGLGATSGRRRYARHVDVPGRRVLVGDALATADPVVDLADLAGDLPGRAGDVAAGRGGTPGGAVPVLAQTSAHGHAAPGTVRGTRLTWDEPQRRVAPGQTVAFYDPADPDLVVGSATASAPPHAGSLRPDAVAPAGAS
jgi:tRNA-uridine 2-sulfurtransferase